MKRFGLAIALLPAVIALSWAGSAGPADLAGTHWFAGGKAKCKLKGIEGGARPASSYLFVGPRVDLPAGRYKFLYISDGLTLEFEGPSPSDRKGTLVADEQEIQRQLAETYGERIEACVRERLGLRSFTWELEVTRFRCEARPRGKSGLLRVKMQILWTVLVESGGDSWTLKGKLNYLGRGESW